MALGVDPKAHREQQEEAKRIEQTNTFQTVTELWRAKRLQEVKEKPHQNEYSPLSRYVLPYIGDKPITEITVPLVRKTLEPIHTTGYSEMLIKVIGAINGVLSFAVNAELPYANPCATISKTFSKKPSRKKPTIRPEELPAFLSDLANSGADLQTRLLIQ